MGGLGRLDTCSVNGVTDRLQFPQKVFSDYKWVSRPFLIHSLETNQETVRKVNKESKTIGKPTFEEVIANRWIMES